MKLQHQPLQVRPSAATALGDRTGVGWTTFRGNTFLDYNDRPNLAAKPSLFKRIFRHDAYQQQLAQRRFEKAEKYRDTIFAESIRPNRNPKIIDKNIAALVRMARHGVNLGQIQWTLRGDFASHHADPAGYRDSLLRPALAHVTQLLTRESQKQQASAATSEALTKLQAGLVASLAANAGSRTPTAHTPTGHGLPPPRAQQVHLQQQLVLLKAEEAALAGQPDRLEDYHAAQRKCLAAENELWILQLQEQHAKPPQGGSGTGRQLG